jgi:hypothetical protein
MTVRFFGDWDFTEADAQSREPARIGYEKGIPMGADLRNAAKARPPASWCTL